MTMNRREFLLKTGWVAGGLTVLSSCSYVPAFPTSLGETEDALGWIQLNERGEFIFYCPRSEMGQGIDTGLTQVVAEELWVDPKHIICILPKTDQIKPVKNTSGSQSVQDYFQPTALAAATLREKLRELASRQLLTPSSHLAIVENGFEGSSGDRISYQEIAATLSSAVVLSDFPDPRPELRSLQHRNYIGQPGTMKSIDRIVHGKPLYARDASCEGMLFGGVARQPFLTAELISFDGDRSLQFAGVVAVVEGPDGLPGVIAKTPMALRKGIAALNCQWSSLTEVDESFIHPDIDIDRSISQSLLNHTELSQRSTSSSPHTIENELDIRFDTPMLAHAAMEPRAGLAHMKKDSLEVWTASQDPFLMQATLANLVGLDKDKVIVNNHRIGGGFGGRLLCQATIEATWLSVAISRPVKVQWNREEEFAYNYVGPQFSHRIHLEIDKDHQIRAWHHRFMASPIMLPRSLIPKSMHWAIELADDFIDDKGVARGSIAPYRFDSHQVDYGTVTTGMPTGPWRGLGDAPNTFATERAMDEAASLTGEDPIDFRLRHIVDDRLENVLNRVRRMSNWDNRSGLGVAVSVYKSVTYVAVVAETALESGKPIVKRMWCAQDCGLMLSPDRIRAQIEGNLTWAVGMVLSEALEMNDGMPESNNFDRYLIARQQQMPEIYIELVDSSLPPTGSGETSFGPGVAALANGLTSLTGQSISELPVHPLLEAAAS